MCTDWPQHCHLLFIYWYCIGPSHDTTTTTTTRVTCWHIDSGAGTRTLAGLLGPVRTGASASHDRLVGLEPGEFDVGAKDLFFFCLDDICNAAGCWKWAPQDWLCLVCTHFLADGTCQSASWMYDTTQNLQTEHYIITMAVVMISV